MWGVSIGYRDNESCQCVQESLQNQVECRITDQRESHTRGLIMMQKLRLRDFVGFGCAGRCVGHDVTRIARAAKLSVLVNP